MRTPAGICLLALTLALAGSADSCDESSQSQSATGVSKAATTVPTGPDGLTVEQRNVKDRLAMDNKPGSIKHLYIISAYSGQVLLYSTVREKVTSSGKRLSPYSVATSTQTTAKDGIPIYIGGEQFRTGEVLQDDGTYGESVPYIYWWDVQGRYHQQYISGDMMVHISDQPIPVKSVTINLEIDPSK